MQTKQLSDLGLVAGLMCLGYKPIERIREEGSRRVNFIFETDEYFDQLCDDYFNGRMDVDALKYSNTLKAVKSGIYQMDQE